MKPGNLLHFLCGKVLTPTEYTILRDKDETVSSPSFRIEEGVFVV
jgi:hypothetical protein